MSPPDFRGQGGGAPPGMKSPAGGNQQGEGKTSLRTYPKDDTKRCGGQAEPARYWGGGSGRLGHVTALSATKFDEFVALVKAGAHRIYLSSAAYHRLEKKWRGQLKLKANFACAAGFPEAGARNSTRALSANLLGMDIDVHEAALRVLSNAEEILSRVGYSFFIHHTISSLPEHNRVRIWIDADNIPNARYRDAVRTVGRLLDVEVSRESENPVQPMFFPTYFEYQWLVGEVWLIAENTDGRPFTVDDIDDDGDPTPVGGLSPNHGPDSIADLALFRRPLDEIDLAESKRILSYLNPGMGRAEWLNVLCGFRHQFPEEADEAFETINDWSSPAHNYGRRAQTEKDWRSLEPNPTDREPITFATVLKMAKEEGYPGPKKDLIRSTEEPWQPLVSLGRAEPSSLDLEFAIPDTLYSLREFIEATAEAVQISTDAVVPLALALISLAASRSFEIQLLPQWKETAPLWIVVLAEPGERKSALLACLTAPFHSWQVGERVRLKHALARYAEARRADEARLAGIRSKISKSKAEDLPLLRREADSLAIRSEGMPALAAPDLLTADATPEAIRELLTRNGEKLGIVSAETDAGQLMGSRYAKDGGANLNLFLNAFTGDCCPAHRIGRDMPLLRPSLAMALAVQPAAVVEVLRDPNARGRGLVDRMCLVQPSSRMGSRVLTPPSVSETLLQWWSDTVHGILDCPWPGRVVLDCEGPRRCETPTSVLLVESDAYKAICVLRTEIESKLKEEGELRPISGFASKLPGVIARIALAFQVMADPKSRSVCLPAIQAACAWAPFLIGHFRAVLGEASESPERRHARRLVAAILRKGLREVTARDCFVLVDNATDLARMEDLEPVLRVLADANYLRPLATTETQAKGRGRPGSPRFAVNPAVFDEPGIKVSQK
jgi:replicative DNA helicase